MSGGARVLLVDDHAIVRAGYRSLLLRHARFGSVSEASDGLDAYRQFRRQQPDLVIMDLSMPGLGGIEALTRLRKVRPSVKVLVFTMHQNAAYALQAIRAGARGYVTKSSAPETMISAACDVLDGKLVLSPDIDHELALTQLDAVPLATEVLTPREFEVLRMLLGGAGTDEIATALNVSPKTVANTRHLIKTKLNVTSDIQLVLLSLRQGLLAFSG